jgi:hypothetical protein
VPTQIAEFGQGNLPRGTTKLSSRFTQDAMAASLLEASIFLTSSREAKHTATQHQDDAWIG